MASAERYEDPEFKAGLEILFFESPNGTLSSKKFCVAQWRKYSVPQIRQFITFMGLRSDEFKRHSNYLFDSRASSITLFDTVNKDFLCSDDIAQGKLGDCWFLSPVASLAEHHEDLLKGLFVENNETSLKKGMVIVKLFNPAFKRWENVVIDDRVPVLAQPYLGLPKYAPLFSRPNEHESWVLLLEKAFAKFHGGYAYIKGGYARHAFECLTGCPISGFVRFSTSKFSYWKKFKLVVSERHSGEQPPYPHNRFNLESGPVGDRISDKAILETIKNYFSKGFVLTCGFKVKGEGLTIKHTYSFLDIFPKNEEDEKFLKDCKYNFGGQILFKLRNPVGRGEWAGLWSKESGTWKRFPKLKERLGPFVYNDGSFFMEYECWKKHVAKIDVCHIPTSAEQMQNRRSCDVMWAKQRDASKPTK